MQVRAAIFSLPFLALLAMAPFGGAVAAKTEYLQKSDEASDKTRQALLHPITLDKGIEAGTLLKDAVDFLADRYDLEIRIDETAFQRMGKSSPARTKVEARRPLLGVHLGAVLQILLEHVDGDVEIRKGVIWIVPLAKPRGLAARLQPASKSFRQQLDQRVTLEQGIDANTQLSDELQYLTDKMQLTLYLDTRAFERAGIKNIGEQPVKLAKQEEVRLAEVLKKLLDQVGAVYLLRGNLVLIVPDPRSSS